MAIHLLKSRDLYRLPVGMHADGAGLYLRVQSAGASRSWAFRYLKSGKRAQVSLGTLASMDLIEARKMTTQLNRAYVTGTDPAEYLKALQGKPTDVIDTTLAGLLPTALKDIATLKRWRNVKSKSQWQASIETYVIPRLGGKEISTITEADVIAVVSPIWYTKTETAKRVLGRLKTIFEWAKAKKYCSGENPAEWDTIKFSLPSPELVKTVEHFKAVKIEDMPGLYQTFRSKNDAISAKAIMFGILTATRVNEFRLAEWKEFDFKKRVWLMPASRRKDGIEFPHRVPLSNQAMELLQDLKVFKLSDKYVFPGLGGRETICADTPRQILRKNGFDTTMHGMRSVFRDWCAETKRDWAASEKALSHSVGTKVTQAYLRTDMLDERRVIMQDWADFLCA